MVFGGWREEGVFLNCHLGVPDNAGGWILDELLTKLEVEVSGSVCYYSWKQGERR